MTVLELIFRKLSLGKWSQNWSGYRRKFAPVKSLRFSELFLGILLSEFRFTAFFGVDSWIPPLQFFQTAKEKASKEAWGGHLSRWGINVTFLHPHESKLSAMRCTPLNQIDPSCMICIQSLMVLCPHYSTLSSPLPFRCDKISRKGQTQIKQKIQFKFVSQHILEFKSIKIIIRLCTVRYREIWFSRFWPVG